VWNSKTRKQYKSLFRSGIPDKLKRSAILQLFRLNAMECETKLEVILGLYDKDFLSHCRENHTLSSNLQYHYLNDEGKYWLEVIIGILIKERGIKHYPVIV
jgi:hypothetical protein